MFPSIIKTEPNRVGTGAVSGKDMRKLEEMLLYAF